MADGSVDIGRPRRATCIKGHAVGLLPKLNLERLMYARQDISCVMQGMTDGSVEVGKPTGGICIRGHAVGIVPKLILDGLEYERLVVSCNAEASKIIQTMEADGSIEGPSTRILIQDHAVGLLPKLRLDGLQYRELHIYSFAEVAGVIGGMADGSVGVGRPENLIAIHEHAVGMFPKLKLDGLEYEELDIYYDDEEAGAIDSMADGSVGVSRPRSILLPTTNLHPKLRLLDKYVTIENPALTGSWTLRRQQGDG